MRRTLKLGWIAALAVGVVALVAGPAGASTVFSFYNLTNNSSGLIDPGDLWVEIASTSLATPAGFTDAATFTFHNDGTTGSIEEIYWYELLPPDIFNGAILVPEGWETPAVPANLPGFDWQPQFVLAASGQETQGKPDQSIKPGSPPLTFTLGLLSGTYDALISGLQSCAGDVLIGLHVQSIGPDDISDSFTTVPVPPAAAIGLLGMGLVGAYQARKRARSAK